MKIIVKVDTAHFSATKKSNLSRKGLVTGLVD